MGVDAQPQDPQAVVQIVFPDRPVPRRRRALEHLGAPDVVDQDVDARRSRRGSGAPARAPRRPRDGRPGSRRPRRRVRRRARRSPRWSRVGRSQTSRCPTTELRPVHTTVAPASPSAAAMPRPAPRVAPATTATRPRRAWPSGVAVHCLSIARKQKRLPDFGIQAHTREGDSTTAIHRRGNRYRPCRRAVVQARGTAQAGAARGRHRGRECADRRVQREQENRRRRRLPRRRAR